MRGDTYTPERKPTQEVDAGPVRDPPRRSDLRHERIQHVDQCAGACAEPLVTVVAVRPLDQCTTVECPMA